MIIIGILLLYLLLIAHHTSFQEYNTCVSSCYLQEPFTRLQESKRTERTTANASLRTSLLKTTIQCPPAQGTDLESSEQWTQHTVPDYSTVPVYGTHWWFIFHHWIVPDLYVCLCMWERKNNKYMYIEFMRTCLSCACAIKNAILYGKGKSILCLLWTSD